MFQCLLILCARYFKSRINNYAINMFLNMECVLLQNIVFVSNSQWIPIRQKRATARNKIGVRFTWWLCMDIKWLNQVFSGLEKWFVHFITICNFCVRTRYYFSFGNCVDSSGFVWWVQSFCVDIFCVGQTDNLLSQAARTTQLELHTKHWPRRETFERTLSISMDGQPK